MAQTRCNVVLTASAVPGPWCLHGAAQHGQRAGSPHILAPPHDCSLSAVQSPCLRPQTPLSGNYLATMAALVARAPLALRTINAPRTQSRRALAVRASTEGDKEAAPGSGTVFYKGNALSEEEVRFCACCTTAVRVKDKS